MTSEFQVLRYRWVILALSWFAFTTSMIPRMAYSPLMLDMSRELSMSYTEAGLLMSGFWAGYMTMQLPGGLISDRIGVKRTLVISLPLMGISTMAIGFASSFIYGLLLRFLGGLAAGCVFAPCSALVARWFSSSERAIASGIYSTSGSAGMLIGILTSTIIASSTGSWRWSFWILGTPAFVAGVTTLLLSRDWPIEAARKASTAVDSSETPPISLIFRSRPMWLMCLVWFGLCLTFTSTMTWAPMYLERVVKVSNVTAGVTTSIIPAVAIASGALGGIIADKVLKRKMPVLFLNAFFLGVGILLISAFQEVDIGRATLLFIFVGFFGGLGWGPGMSVLAEWFHRQILGTAFGFLNFVGQIGSVIGPFIFGLILDATGSFASGWMFLGTAGIVTALPALLLMLMERKN